MPAVTKRAEFFLIIIFSLVFVISASASEDSQIVCIEESQVRCVTVAVSAGVGIGALRNSRQDVEDVVRTQGQISDIQRRHNQNIIGRDNNSRPQTLTQTQVKEVAQKISSGGQAKVVYYLSDTDNRQIYIKGIQKSIDQQKELIAAADRKAFQAMMNGKDGVEDPAYSEEKMKSNAAKERIRVLENEQREINSGNRKVKPVKFVKVFQNAEPEAVERFLLTKTAKDIKVLRVTHLPVEHASKVVAATAKIRNLKLRGRAGVAALGLAGFIAAEELSVGYFSEKAEAVALQGSSVPVQAYASEGAR